MNKNQTKIPSKKNNHQKKNLLRQNNSVSKFNSKLGSKPLAKNSNFAGRGVWLYGKHPVFLALQKKRREIFQILATKNSVIELEKFLQEKNLLHLKSRLTIVESSQIEALIGKDQIHQGLALNCSQVPPKSQNDLLEELKKILSLQSAKSAIDENEDAVERKSDQAPKNMPPLLIMDQLRDPHNVGAIIRSACAFGVKKIIFPEHNFPKESAVMNKSASGMVENVDLYLVVNINNLMLKLKELGYWCIGLAGEGEVLVEKIREYKNIALIVGSEGDGIRDLVRRNCDLLVRIEIDENVESLNASVASSIALREVFLSQK